MNNASILLLFLFIAVSSAALLRPRSSSDSHCNDCRGLFSGCFYGDLMDCEHFNCPDTGDCNLDNCKECVQAKRSFYEDFFKRSPNSDNDCDADCAGFPAGCPCGNLDYCAEGCSTGECNEDNCEPDEKRSFKAFLKSQEKKRTFGELFRKSTSNSDSDCDDCAGFPAGCPCENLDYCRGCDSTGECNTGNCESDEKRSFKAFLNSQEKKRFFKAFLKSRDNGCADCAGFPSDCPCSDRDLCLDNCGTAGECADNCVVTA